MLFAIAAASIGIIGCNDIDSDERFIELPPIEGNRVVLLEDYTGQSCPNCPEGHRVISLCGGIRHTGHKPHLCGAETRFRRRDERRPGSQRVPGRGY